MFSVPDVRALKIDAFSIDFIRKSILFQSRMPRRSKSMVMAMAMAMAMVVTMGKRFSHSLYIQTPDRPPQRLLLVLST